MKNILIKVILFLLVIVGIEFSIVLFMNKGYSIMKSSLPQIAQTQGEVYNSPIETGLLSAYMYFFEIKDLSITKKSVVVGEYEGVIKSVDLTKNKALVFYFKDFSGWFTLYKQPTQFKETKCQLYNKAKAEYAAYNFEAPPFKANDMVDIMYEFDFQNRLVSCKIKVIN